MNYPSAINFSNFECIIFDSDLLLYGIQDYWRGHHNQASLQVTRSNPSHPHVLGEV